MADLSQFLYDEQQPSQQIQGSRAPWENMSPAKTEEMKVKEAEAARKVFSDIATNIKSGEEKLRLLNEFGQLNRQVGTASILENPVIDFFIPNAARSNEFRRMQSITSKLTPQERPVGSGATSDFEQRLYREGTVGVDKPGPVNKAIRVQAEQALQAEKDRLDFIQKYYDEKGYLSGAENAFIQSKQSSKQGTAKKSIYDAADAIIGGK
jgi:hypothetical protein